VHAGPLVGAPGNGPRIYNASGKTKPYPNQQFIIGRTLLVTRFVLDAIKIKQSPATRGIIPSDWIKLARWPGSPEAVPDKFWRTLVADRGHKPPPAYFPLACKWERREWTVRYGTDAGKWKMPFDCYGILTAGAIRGVED